MTVQTGPDMDRYGHGLFAATDDSWDHPRTTGGAAILCEWATARGVALGTLLEGSGIEPWALADPHELIEARQEIAVIRNLLGAFGRRPGLGIELGRLFHLTAYGSYGYLLVASSSVREALRCGLKYRALTFAFSALTAHRDGERRYVIDLRADDVPDDIRRFAVERDLAGIVQITRELFPRAGRSTALEVRLAFAADGRGAERWYEERLGVPVTFGCARTEVVLDAGYLDLPLPMANAHTARVMEEQCERIRAQRLHHVGVAARVRAHLRDQPSLDLTFEEVAEALCHPPRTLRRHLAHEGTSFRELLEEVRRTVAEDMLRDPSRPRYQIAQRLGYQDWSSFLRARRRWSGSLPTPR
ncbi:AraC family transcriptional regulator ligand-binding domain-containing protein [Streptomyces sp. NPDC004237]|uniref:AraC family transcriptional regulator n=1 Tax=Streptomyces sp. NPDC004237 TaxID=3154455 RepID=UPI0033BF909C